MVARPLQAIALCCAMITTLTGCAEGPLSVRLDLCPGLDASAADLELIQGVESWNVEVWGIENDDAAWRRVWAGSEALDQLVLEGAVPPDRQVRVLIEGFGLDPSGDHRVVALGASGLLLLQGTEELCICVAPPERYAELCEVWSCSFNAETGVCESPR